MLKNECSDFLRNAIKFVVKFYRKRVKCGELYFFTAFNAFLTLVCPKNRCGESFKKCGEMRWSIFVHHNQGNHRFSYKNSPHSTHFLRKLTQRPRVQNWFNLNSSEKIISLISLHKSYKIRNALISFIQLTTSSDGLLYIKWHVYLAMAQRLCTQGE